MPSNCGHCGIAFKVEPEEVEWIAANDAESPNLCPRCRAFKTGLQDESITCTMCGKVFIYPRELRLFSRLFNWPRPRRCIGGCRRQAPPLTEIEEKMADFLRRVRSARRSSIGGGLPSRGSVAGSPSRVSSSSPNRNSGAADGVGDSLAQALREFQQKKRRRS